MTRKDFEVVAQVLATLKIDGGTLARGKIDAILTAQNPRYDAEKFWQAVKKYQ